MINSKNKIAADVLNIILEKYITKDQAERFIMMVPGSMSRHLGLDVYFDKDNFIFKGKVVKGVTKRSLSEQFEQGPY